MNKSGIIAYSFFLLMTGCTPFVGPQPQNQRLATPGLLDATSNGNVALVDNTQEPTANITAQTQTQSIATDHKTATPIETPSPAVAQSHKNVDNHNSPDPSEETSAVIQLTHDADPTDDPMVQTERMSRSQEPLGSMFASGAALAHAYGIKNINFKLPKNTRQVPESFWIGSTPDAESIFALKQKGIKLIVSITNMSKKDSEPLKELIAYSGLQMLHLPFSSGMAFPKPERFIHTIRNFKQNEVYIHCNHGADRSGAMLAYLLMSEGGMSIPEALYSIVFPASADINGIEAILNERGIKAPPKQYKRFIGIYSASKNGGFGGLKCHNEKYATFAASVLDVMIANQPQQKPD